MKTKEEIVNGIVARFANEIGNVYEAGRAWEQNNPYYWHPDDVETAKKAAYQKGLNDALIAVSYEERKREDKNAEEKTGVWIPKGDSFLKKCSVCGEVIYSETERDCKAHHAFCGCCGAKMKIGTI